MNKYERYGIQIPELVQQAIKLAEEIGFPVMPEGRSIGFQGPPSACIPEVGQLLRGLAASYPDGQIVEHGTGAGIGTAWLVSGMTANATLISAELDAKLAQALA